MGVLLLIVALILFVCLVLVHELGHFIIARRNGVKAEEFGLGMPPRVWARKTKSGLLVSINWLPLGGFVRLHGEHDADTGPGTYGAASTWAKTKIVAAGVIMNLVAAFVLFTLLAWIGMPQLVGNQFTIKSDTKVAKHEVLVGSVVAGSPAAKAGLQSHDELLSIGPVGQQSQSILSSFELPKLTKQFAGQKVTLRYMRNGNDQQTTVQLLSAQEVEASLKTNNQKYYLGLAPFELSLQRSTWSAPIVALGIMKQFTVLTYKGLGLALKGVGSIIAGALTGNHQARVAGQAQASGQVSGPVGIFVILKDGSALGYQLMLMIIAVISLTLAIMNVLPIPALDGGKLFVMYVARAFRRHASQNVEDWAYGASFVALLALMALITIVDVKRFF